MRLSAPGASSRVIQTRRSRLFRSLGRLQPFNRLRPLEMSSKKCIWATRRKDSTPIASSTIRENPGLIRGQKKLVHSCDSAVIRDIRDRKRSALLAAMLRRVICGKFLLTFVLGATVDAPGAADSRPFHAS